MGGNSSDERASVGAKIIIVTAYSEDLKSMVTYTPANISKFLVVKNELEETKRKYKEEIERLEKELEIERQAELESVIAEVKATIKRYDLTAKDLGLTGKTGRPRGKASKVHSKVVNPAT